MGTSEFPVSEGSNINLESLTSGSKDWLTLFGAIVNEKLNSTELAAKILNLNQGELSPALAYYESSAKDQQISEVKDALRDAGVVVDVEHG